MGSAQIGGGRRIAQRVQAKGSGSKAAAAARNGDLWLCYDNME